MPRTGRQPYATTDVLPFGTGTRRLRPPDGLSDTAKAAFLDLVTTCPADSSSRPTCPCCADGLSYRSCARPPPSSYRQRGCSPPPGSAIRLGCGSISIAPRLSPISPCGCASARKAECRRHRGGRLGRSRISTGWNWRASPMTQATIAEPQLTDNDRQALELEHFPSALNRRDSQPLSSRRIWGN